MLFTLDTGLCSGNVHVAKLKKSFDNGSRAGSVHTISGLVCVYITPFICAELDP